MHVLWNVHYLASHDLKRELLLIDLETRGHAPTFLSEGHTTWKINKGQMGDCLTVVLLPPSSPVARNVSIDCWCFKVQLLLGDLLVQ